MALKRTADRVRGDIIRLCQAGLDSQTLRREALRKLSQAIPIDAFFCAAADPATLLFTGSVLEGIPERAVPHFLQNEFLQDDVNKFAQLTRGQSHVRSLAQATGGDLEDSPRYRDLLAPMHLGDELRAAIMSGRTCWGFMCLHREASSPSFTAADSAYVTGLLPHIAEGLRRALLLDRALAPSESDAPGLLILAEDWVVISSTAAAERWLAEVAEVDWPGTMELPLPVYALAARLRLAERTGTAPELMPLARLRTSAGRWLTLHASRLSGRSSHEQTAIIIEPATPHQMAPLIAQAYALSARETEITQVVLQGLTTDEIAGQLCISQLTVQDHVNAIFDKVGVRSRRELVARIFGEHYRPRIARAATL
ncbi:MAG TPA: LuxR C-terminal-related transcriptional regulator [Chloroflexota bacterium]